MKLPVARGPLLLTCRRCFMVALWPTLVVVALALGIVLTFPPRLADENAPGAASPWLTLPLATAAMACALAAAAFWPSFARSRPGQGWVDRLQRGALGGGAAAIAGALLAQLLLTLPLATVLARLLGAPTAASLHVTLVPPADPVLDANRPRVAFDVPAGVTCRELRVRPLAGLPTGRVLATTVDVIADGERLGSLPVAIAETRQLVRFAFPPRPLRRLELVLVAGQVPLVFGPESATLIGDSSRSHWINGALVAAIGLLPTFVTLALAAWCGLAAALPTVIAVVASLLFVQTIGGVGPFDDVVLAHLRGQWLPASVVFQQSAPSLAVGCLAMILGMLLRPRIRR